MTIREIGSSPVEFWRDYWETVEVTPIVDWHLSYVFLRER